MITEQRLEQIQKQIRDCSCSLDDDESKELFRLARLGLKYEAYLAMSKKVNRLEVDIAGQKFGRLKAVEPVWINKRKRWRCDCECGGETVASYSNLKDGDSASCGCIKKEKWAKRVKAQTMHSKSGTKTFKIWCGMIARCKTKSAKGYKNYGGRGIRVCERWQQFELFLEDMGSCPPRFSIERINNDGNYEPSNCKWIPLRDQGKNTRRSKKNKALAQLPKQGEE